MSTAPGSRDWAGITLALASAVAFALANASAGLAYRGGSNPLTIAAVRFVLPTVVLIVWLHLSGVTLRLPTRDGWIAAVLGAIAAIYTLALLSAINAIPLGLAILIFYLFPLVAAVILRICGWEKLSWRIIAGIVLAFAGLALALDPRGRGHDVTGVTLAFVGALGLGIVVAVSSRVIRARDSRPVTLYMAAVAGVLLIALCTARGEFQLPQTSTGWVGFVGAAGFYAFALIAAFMSIALIGPMRSSLLSYVEPVTAAGLGIALLGETLAPLQFTGIALIIVALVGATWSRRAKAR
jgi:drug/metabolite transporter (DMT)-like permease